MTNWRNSPAGKSCSGREPEPRGASDNGDVLRTKTGGAFRQDLSALARTLPEGTSARIWTSHGAALPRPVPRCLGGSTRTRIGAPLAAHRDRFGKDLNAGTSPKSQTQDIYAS